MRAFELIGRGVTWVLAVGQRVAGTVIAVNQLLFHPDHVQASSVILGGILLLGGQASKDLLLGLIDRILEPHKLAAKAIEEKEKAPVVELNERRKNQR